MGDSIISHADYRPPGSVQPITPDEAVQQHLESIPDKVIEIINGLIRDNMSGSSALVYTKDIIAAIADQMNVESQMVYDRGWLDIKPLYEKVGWNIFYDRPGWDETYDAHFIFRKP